MKKLFGMIFLLSIVFCSCEKQEETESDNLVGNYVLVDVHWTGLYKDLDNNGIGMNDLLGEYHSMIGYYEPNNVADIRMVEPVESWEQGGDVFAINVMLPVPEYVKHDDLWQVRGLRYQPMTLRKLGNHPYTTVYIKQYEQGKEHLEDIYGVSASDFEDGTFKVSLHFTMLHVDLADKSQTLETAYLEFTYKKIN